MARTWREFLGAWDDYRVEARGYHELDEERAAIVHGTTECFRDRDLGRPAGEKGPVKGQEKRATS